MRKTLLLTYLLAATLVVSCGGHRPGGARDTADRFFQAAVVDVDTDAAREYVSPGLLEEFPERQKMTGLEKNLFAAFREYARTHGYGYEFDTAQSEIGEREALVRYRLTVVTDPGWKGAGEVELRKDDSGRWIVTDYEFDRYGEPAEMDF